MLTLILFCVLHCIMSFLVKYCYDTVELWNLKETPPEIKMPTLYDLKENINIYNQQKYIEQVILPSHDYFAKISDIKRFQDCSVLSAWMCMTPTFLLVSTTFLDFDLPKVMKFILAILLPSILIFVVCVIYNRTSLKLKTFEFTRSKLKERYNQDGYFCEFDISENSKQNNFNLEMHNEYIVRIYPKIANRYRVRLAIEFVCGIIYLLFIKRFPD